MKPSEAPFRVELPSHRVVSLEARPGLLARKRRRAAPLFSELVELVSTGDLVLRGDGAPFDVRSLALSDFHALRAICTRRGWLYEEPVEIACRNCGRVTSITPCEGLPLGPFLDGELRDPELDVLLDLSVRHRIPPVALQDGRLAEDVQLRPLTVEMALPLHRALRRRTLVISEHLVRAMGIGSLGSESDAARIAEVLARCSDAPWDRVCELFLRAHYPLRLGAVVVCSQCGARNDVDAPFEREFAPGACGRPAGVQQCPDFEEFARRAELLFVEIAGPLADEVRLVVEEGVAACDEGGEPLLGAYMPPDGDPSSPVGAGEVTVYHRTFRSAAMEDGGFDWDSELEETIDHELRHHEGWRVGYDPMDDSERGEIVREQERVLGRGTVARATVNEFGADLRGFVVRAWPLWVIVVVATVATNVCSK